jgi:SET domain-containing protein
MHEKKFDIDYLIKIEEGSIKENKKEDHLLTLDILEKKKSSIHGFGVFSKEKIASRKKFYSVPMLDIRNNPAPKLAKISTNIFVNDPKVLNWVNHSCDANSEIIFDQKGIFLRSKREIQPGEEITLDYCSTEEKNVLIECKCNSPKCRNYFFLTA